MAKLPMEKAIPCQEMRNCSAGDIRASPTPALAWTIPETAAAFFSPIMGVIADMTMPNESAPVPEGSMMPKKSSIVGNCRHIGVAMRPVRIIAIPMSMTNELDFLSARSPKQGCTSP